MNKKTFLFLVVAMILLILAVSAVYLSKSEDEIKLTDNNMNILITSPAFKDGLPIPKKYTCDGENVSPEFFISGVPENAKSLVLISDDPDAPNGDWVHWVLYNIDPKTDRIREGEMPAGAIGGKTSFGHDKYGGPCPPSGKTHHYYFKIYALNITLDIGPVADKQAVLEAIGGHILAEGQVMGIYER